MCSAHQRQRSCIAGVRFPGLIHPGLIGTAPSHELLKIWNDRERKLVEEGPEGTTLGGILHTRPLGRPVCSSLALLAASSRIQVFAHKTSTTPQGVRTSVQTALWSVMFMAYGLDLKCCVLSKHGDRLYWTHGPDEQNRALFTASSLQRGPLARHSFLLSPQSRPATLYQVETSQSAAPGRHRSQVAIYSLEPCVFLGWQFQRRFLTKWW